MAAKKIFCDPGMSEFERARASRRPTLLFTPEETRSAKRLCRDIAALRMHGVTEDLIDKLLASPRRLLRGVIDELGTLAVQGAQTETKNDCVAAAIRYGSLDVQPSAFGRQGIPPAPPAVQPDDFDDGMTQLMIDVDWSDPK